MTNGTTAGGEWNMKELLTVITRKGQVTIPAEIRKSMGLKQGDKVAFRVDQERVELVPAGSVVARTMGALKGKEKPLTARELRRAGEEAIAEEAFERSKR